MICLVFHPFHSLAGSNSYVRNISYAHKENYLLKDDGICVIMVKKKSFLRYVMPNGIKINGRIQT